jgi:hypothetical protein
MQLFSLFLTLAIGILLIKVLISLPLTLIHFLSLPDWLVLALLLGVFAWFFGE